MVVLFMGVWLSGMNQNKIHVNIEGVAKYQLKPTYMALTRHGHRLNQNPCVFPNIWLFTTICPKTVYGELHKSVCVCVCVGEREHPGGSEAGRREHQPCSFYPCGKSEKTHTDAEIDQLPLLQWGTVHDHTLEYCTSTAMQWNTIQVFISCSEFPVWVPGISRDSLW